MGILVIFMEETGFHLACSFPMPFLAMAVNFNLCPGFSLEIRIRLFFQSVYLFLKNELEIYFAQNHFLPGNFNCKSVE